MEVASRVQIRAHGVIAGARYIRWERIYRSALDEVYDVVHGVGAMAQINLVIEY